MEFVRFLNQAETLSKLNRQGKVGKAALWAGRRLGLGTVPGSSARKFMSEVTVYLICQCREKTCHLRSWMPPSSSQFGRCCFNMLPGTSCSVGETTSFIETSLHSPSELMTSWIFLLVSNLLLLYLSVGAGSNDCWFIVYTDLCTSKTASATAKIANNGYRDTTVCCVLWAKAVALIKTIKVAVCRQ